MLVGHLPELILVLVVLLLLVGPGKIPSLGGAIGKTIRGFKQETQGRIHGPGETTIPEREGPRQG
ncbi:MAG TPA: twin-arginine translocase TatA/TatE family subunit [Chloroflexota bacterium]|nr:twin-arginine translocase TatA/TatE family subunit [Chloroflexota bacterium]